MLHYSKTLGAEGILLRGHIESFFINLPTHRFNAIIYLCNKILYTKSYSTVSESKQEASE